MDETKKILCCLLCDEKFSVKDVEQGRFFLGTYICRGCYTDLQAKSHTASCFGKNSEESGGVLAYGYHPTAFACSTACPDRKACATFIQQLESV